MSGWDIFDGLDIEGKNIVEKAAITYFVLIPINREVYSDFFFLWCASIFLEEGENGLPGDEGITSR